MSPARVAKPVTVTIGDKELVPAYAGIVSAGLYQINIQVPDLPPGEYPLGAKVGEARTPEMV